MFQIFQKKQQYQKVSSKFKDHFEHRGSKVDFVTSNETKIQEKMNIFKELINDNLKPQRKSSLIKASYFRQKKKTKASQLEQKQISDLAQMTDGFIQWANLKNHKNKHKNDFYSWSHYKEQKHARKEKESVNLKEIIKQKLNLKQLKTTHRAEKFQTDMKAKIQNNIFQKEPSSPFHLTCRKSAEKQNYFFEIYKMRNKKKYKLAKYFGQMKEFNCHKKYYSQNQSTFSRETRSLQGSKIMNRTLLNSPFNHSIGGMLTPFEGQIFQNRPKVQNIEEFKDDQIYEVTKFKRNNKHQQRKTHAGIMNENVSEYIQNESSSINQYKLEKMPENLIKSIKVRGNRVISQQENHKFSDAANYPFDIKKLNAVRKIKCF